MSTRILAATIFASTLLSAPAHAEWGIGAGVEHYNWEEKVPDSSLAPYESGSRYTLHLKWVEDGDSGLLYAFNGELYSGQVGYDTYPLGGGSTPVPTQTVYNGLITEGRLIWRGELDGYRLDYVGGLGLDRWRRTISGNQIEDYSILFLRTGLSLDQPRQGTGFHGGGGLKLPLATDEDAHLDSLGFNANPHLSPGRNVVSLYAELAYRTGKYWDIVGYYDSWRFTQSERVLATTSDPTLCGSPLCSFVIVQPQSSMNAFGLKAMYSF